MRKIIANNYTPGETIKILREWSEMTQEDFAKILGYKGRSAITKIESDITKISFNKLMELAKNENLIITIEKK